MMRALYSSVAGLKTHQTKMDVIGNNIANVNTVGFKSSRVTFSTMMYQSLSGASGANVEMGTGGVNAKQIGLGTNFASTAISIDSGGAAESTGFAFDLKISDKNTTSFYIVNNGSENVFTRAGAFYVDGAGNLCMESTGYTVMGWQVDANGNIQKDTVSPLKIMSAENQSSAPEYTTRALASGILDDNNANVNSDTGYIMSLNFFDNRGYSYNARFATQKTGGEDSGEYTINLVDIIDSNGASIMSRTQKGLGDLFGSTTVAQGSNVDITNNYTVASGKTAALKNLAMPDGFNSDSPQSSNYEYTFTAETVNQYMHTNLPEGEGIKVVLTYPGAVNNPDNQDTAHTVTILNRNGDIVTDDYMDSTLYPWLKQDGGNTFITDEVTLDDVLSELESNGTIVLGEELTEGQLESIADSFGWTLEQLQQEATAAGATSQLAAGMVVVSVAGGYEIVSRTTTGTPPVTTDTTVISGADLERTYTLDDYIEYAFLEVSATDANSQGIFTTELPKDVEIRYGLDGSYKIVTPTEDGFTLKFSTVDGHLEYIGQQGNLTQTLRMGEFMPEGNPFTNITIDFSTIKNLANGSSCTAALSAGDADADGKGKKVGAMIGLSVDQSGKIYGSYDNGNTVLLGQIAVARFANASGLESLGNNCFKTTLNSGDFDGIGVEIDSDGSSINSGELEMSNVDLATEFTQMITTQRGYQANSRVISTSDSILEELVNLKR